MRPGDDFFGYALGGWYARTQIASDQSEASVDVEVADRVQSELREIIEHSFPTATELAETEIGGLYRSYLNEPQIEAQGSAPLRSELRSAAITTRDRFVERMAASYSGYGASFFALQVSPDAKRADYNALVLGQDGLGLPDRDYYLVREFEQQRREYLRYVARTLAMVGIGNPQHAASAVVALETRIARASWPEVRTRELTATYNPMSLDELQSYAPGVDWRRFLTQAGARDIEYVIVSEPDVIRDLAALVAATPIEVLRNWEIFRTADHASPYLSRRFVDSRFAFRGQVLAGMQTMRPRWKRGVALVDAELGQALGRLYVRQYFSPETKRQAVAMVDMLMAAMRARIEAATWMSPATRQEALDKLARMKVFVGYPDQWRDYSGLRIDPQDLYGNVARSTAFNWAYEISKAGQPLDPHEWGPVSWRIQPQTVDAFNIPSENKIIFPAAILQPPYFEPLCDAAANYGAMGGIIGHEITHGFDDQGRKVDASGRLRDWWTPQDETRFKAEANKLVRQVSAYEILPGIHVNGQQTLGENIADLGGLLLALDAYRASLAGSPAPIVAGLTGDQRVFLGWASRWRRKVRDQALISMATSDVHAPAKFRVTGPVRNIDAWYTAFQVGPADRLYLEPRDRAHVW